MRPSTQLPIVSVLAAALEASTGSSSAAVFRSAPRTPRSSTSGTLLRSSPRRPSDPQFSSVRGFATSMPARGPVAETAASAAASSSSATAASTSQVGFAFLEPYVPYLHSLSETLNITGPHASALSIFALAFAVRTITTLPMTIWQRQRTQRMAELVIPQWQAYKEKAPNVVRARCRRAGKSYEEFQKELQADLKGKLRQLLKDNRCSPLPSFLAPLAVHLPVFLALSALIRQAAIVPGSPFAAEVLPWWSPSPDLAAQMKASASILADRGMEPELIAKLQGTQGGPTLADRDTTMVGPLSFGLLTMTNVELTSWSRRTLAKLASSDVATSAAAQKDSKQTVVGDPTSAAVTEDEEPRRTRIMTNAFRILAIAAIPIAIQAPGALIIYWLSSGTYTLMQNSVFAFIDRQSEARKQLAKATMKTTAKR